MQSRQLDRIKERLLKAGVAPRHIHRYVRELRDHYEDALREELAKGPNRASAEQTAWARIGDEESLTNSVLARPELRSVIARFSRLIFGAAPFFIWLGFLVLVFLVMFMTFGHSAGPERTEPYLTAYALVFFCVRVLPVALGIAALTICIRQRLTSPWPVIGTAIVAVISGTFSLSLTLPTAGQMGQLGMSSALFPFLFPQIAVGKPDIAALVVGLTRAAGMLAISLLPYLFWLRHQRALQTNT